MPSFYDIAADALDGSPNLLERARGKVTLAVNVASRCGLTPQYTGLEQLQREIAAEGFTVIGFPCNQFGAQEPGTAEQIQQFCSTTYGVSFPLSAKLDVNGPGRHAVYRYLLSPETGIPGDIGWNFEKFLVSRAGKVLRRYPPPTRPDDRGMLQDIADALEGIKDHDAR